MDLAKFCPAAQGRSTAESQRRVVLLRARIVLQQEQDHALYGDATALRLTGRGS